MTDLIPQSPLSLPATARSLAEASISEGTRNTYASVLSTLDDHLRGADLTDTALAAYLSMQFEAGKSPALASLIVAAVRFRSKLHGEASPAGPATDRVLAGFRRKGRDRGRGQVAGIRWEQADATAAIAAKTGSPKGLRDAAILAVGSDALLRVSEIAALNVEDLETEEDSSGRLTVRHSKTDQEGQGAVEYLGPTTVTRIQAWLEVAGISRGPLFRLVRKDGKPGSRPLTPHSVRRIIAERAADAGIEGRVSGHSLRVGAAQSLAAAGASLVEMQTAGRWLSPSMPGHYARGQLAGRGAVARLRYGGDGGG